MKKTIVVTSGLLLCVLAFWYFSTMLSLGFSLFRGTPEMNVEQVVIQEKSEPCAASSQSTKCEQPTNIKFLVKTSRPIVGTILGWIFAIVLTYIPVRLIANLMIKPIKHFSFVDSKTLLCAMDQDGLKSYSERSAACHKVLEVLESSGSYNDDERRRIKQSLRNISLAPNTLKELFESKDREVKSHAKEIAAMAAVSVVISRSPALDGVALLFWKVRLVYDTVKIYGLRPSISDLMKLYAFAAFGAFLSGSLEEMCDLVDISSGVSRISQSAGTVVSMLTAPIAITAQASLAIYMILRTQAMVSYAIMNGSDSINSKDIKDKANVFAKENFADVMSTEKLNSIIKLFRDRVSSITSPTEDPSKVA